MNYEINLFSEEEKSWIEAERYCRSKYNGHIHTLTINDLNLVDYVENNILWTGMKKQIYSYWIGRKSNLTGYNKKYIYILCFVL